MAELEAFGEDAESGRALRLLELAGLDAWPADLALPTAKFVLLLCCDARGVSDAALGGVARRALAQGMVYLCAWGPECDRVETVFEECAAAVGGSDEPESAILTESDGEEPLSQALRIAIREVAPATDFEASCGTTLVVCAGMPRRAETLRELLEDPVDLDDDAYEIDDDE